MTTDLNLNKYDFDLSRNGVRKADSQFFWFQSSLGPNSLYYGTALGNDFNGNKTYIDVYLPPSISSKTTNFYDMDNTLHCAIYSRKQKGMALGNNWGWNNQLEHLQAQKVFDYPVTSRQIASVVDTDWAPNQAGLNYVGGCNYKAMSNSYTNFSRLRIR